MVQALAHLDVIVITHSCKNSAFVPAVDDLPIV